MIWLGVTSAYQFITVIKLPAGLFFAVRRACLRKHPELDFRRRKNASSDRNVAMGVL